MNFQIILLIIAVVILIIMLIIIGITLTKSSDVVWPPIIGDCPDYWVDLSGNGAACLNSHNLGRCNKITSESDNVMNFDVAPYNTSTGNCSKYKWATQCKVTWDGITSGVKNPCDTTT